MSNELALKTEEIKKSIGRLEDIQKKFYELADSDVTVESSACFPLCEQMKSELQNLKLWIEMLYKYNGTSKSWAKVAASRENGKKGGRPPKFVTELKKQKAELELLLENLHSQEIISSIEDGQRIDEERRTAEGKLYEVEEKLSGISKNQISLD